MFKEFPHYGGSVFMALLQLLLYLFALQAIKWQIERHDGEYRLSGPKWVSVGVRLAVVGLTIACAVLSGGDWALLAGVLLVLTQYLATWTLRMIALVAGAAMLLVVTQFHSLLTVQLVPLLIQLALIGPLAIWLTAGLAKRPLRLNRLSVTGWSAVLAGAALVDWLLYMDDWFVYRLWHTLQIPYSLDWTLSADEMVRELVFFGQACSFGLLTSMVVMGYLCAMKAWSILLDRGVVVGLPLFGWAIAVGSCVTAVARHPGSTSMIAVFVGVALIVQTFIGMGIVGVVRPMYRLPVQESKFRA